MKRKNKGLTQHQKVMEMLAMIQANLIDLTAEIAVIRLTVTDIQSNQIGVESSVLDEKKGKLLDHLHAQLLSEQLQIHNHFGIHVATTLGVEFPDELHE